MDHRKPRPFTSHVKMMVLTLVLPHVDRWFYQREIQFITGIAYTPIRFALIDLEVFGLLNRKSEGRRQYYTVARDFFLYEEYKRIVLKTTGLGDHLRWVSREKKNLQFAFIHGDFAEGTESDATPIRFCSVGTIGAARIRDALEPAGKATRQKYEFQHMTPEEFSARSRRPDAAWRKILQGEKIFVVGKPADYTRLLSP